MQFKTKLMALALASAMPLQAMALEPATDLGDALTNGKVSGMLRLRYEGVEQGAKDDAAALTLRSSIGYETKPLNGFSFKAIGYNLAHLVKEFNDTQNGETRFPVVADPQDTDFHNLYLQYANGGNKFRVGRQNIFLDNWRMVGDVRFRQNWQVFDGFTYENTMFKNTKVFYGFFNRFKHVNTKQFDIKSHFLNANYKITKGTSVTGYAYLNEFEQAPATSTKTFGIRVNGKEKVGDGLAALFTAEYAKQDDYADASNIDADYYFVSGGVGIAGWAIRLNHEFLSGTDTDSTQPFKPHFGTNHLFQGWTDLFLGTPATGIEDTFVSAVGKFMGAKIKAEYHMIDADNSNAAGDDEYGTEFDLGVYYKFKKNIIGSFEYAKFNQEDASLGKPDTEKFWVTGIYKF